MAAKNIKLVWRVQPEPTGPYRSFHKRGWPKADYADGSTAFALYCDTRYSAYAAKSGDHGPITIRVADHSHQPVWKWRTLVKRAATLKEAKEIAAKFVIDYPEFLPKSLTENGE